jgi:curved DNA-binding protein CbpA
MPQAALPTDWSSRFLFDHYAVLGIPLTADDRRITKRLRTVSKVLHPDVQAIDTTREFATLMLSKVVNPAYERLKQEKGRNEVKAMLRMRVRQLNRNDPWQPESDIARQLLQHPASNVEVFYEQAVSNLAATQYEPLTAENFEAVTRQLVELNFAYFQLTMGEGFFRSERRTGVLPAAAAVPQQFTPAPTPEVRQESYDRRHYRRANQYMKRAEWALAEQELREAIKIKADEADYHALLGIVYHYKKLDTLAKVYLRQALKLKPDHTMALRYATKVGIVPASPTAGNSAQKPPLKLFSQNGKVPGQTVGSRLKPSQAKSTSATPHPPSPLTPDAAATPDTDPQATSRRSVSYVSPTVPKSKKLLNWIRRLLGSMATKK